jgi:hypothetical protein
MNLVTEVLILILILIFFFFATKSVAFPVQPTASLSHDTTTILKTRLMNMSWQKTRPSRLGTVPSQSLFRGYLYHFTHCFLASSELA